MILTCLSDLFHRFLACYSIGTNLWMKTNIGREKTWWEVNLSTRCCTKKPSTLGHGCRPQEVGQHSFHVFPISQLRTPDQMCGNIKVLLLLAPWTFRKFWIEDLASGWCLQVADLSHKSWSQDISSVVSAYYGSSWGCGHVEFTCCHAFCAVQWKMVSNAFWYWVQRVMGMHIWSYLCIGVQTGMMNCVCTCIGLSVCRMCSVVSVWVNLQLTLNPDNQWYSHMAHTDLHVPCKFAIMEIDSQWHGWYYIITGWEWNSLLWTLMSPHVAAKSQ